LAGHEGGVACLGWAPAPWCLLLTAGAYRACVAHASELRLYDYLPHGVLRPRPSGLCGHRGQVHSLLAVPPAAQLVSADSCGGVLVWALLGAGAGTRLQLAQRLDLHAWRDPSPPRTRAVAGQAWHGSGGAKADATAAAADGRPQEPPAAAASARVAVAAAATPLAAGRTAHAATVRAATVRRPELAPPPGGCLLAALVQPAKPRPPGAVAAAAAEAAAGAGAVGTTSMEGSSPPPPPEVLTCVGRGVARLVREKGACFLGLLIWTRYV
jgi:hypothetical protein